MCTTSQIRCNPLEDSSCESKVGKKMMYEDIGMSTEENI